MKQLKCFKKILFWQHSVDIFVGLVVALKSNKTPFKKINKTLQGTHLYFKVTPIAESIQTIVALISFSHSDRQFTFSPSLVVGVQSVTVAANQSIKQHQNFARKHIDF